MTSKVIVASGYFNPLHYGHVSYLQKAKALGGSLLVIVNNDRQLGLRQEVYPEFEKLRMPVKDRVKLIRSLACVDAAFEAIDTDESVSKTLRVLHPDIFANGGQRVATPSERAVCEELGIQIRNGLGIEMVRLSPYTQHYDWGKRKSVSIVAQLTGASQLSPQHDKAYAELWMGDHPSGPSSFKDRTGSTNSLCSMFEMSPNVLGPKIAKEGGKLPFLLKVLSIEKALSIQAHPDRALAAKLHAAKPDAYKDPNHKPEIAIALNDFEALCGFRSIPDLVKLVEAVPEFRTMVGEENAVALANSEGDCDKEWESLKAAFSHMMHSSDEVMIKNVKGLLARANSTCACDTLPAALQKIFSLVPRLHKDFGDDIGIFSLFFLNIVEMKTGECLYMPANTPHAYLSGDIVECMACSDNVVRGGLTPKFKDVEVLCDMLIYKGGEPPQIRPAVMGPGVLLYRHEELEDFQVTHVKIEASKSHSGCFSTLGPTVAFALRGTGSMMISGECTDVTPGAVFFLAAGAEFKFDASSDLHIFAACCPPNYFKK